MKTMEKCTHVQASHKTKEKKTVDICYIDIGPVLILFKLPLFTAVDNFPLLVLCHLPAD